MEYAGIEDLAQAVDRTYAGRMLRLTSLAPDIVKAILHGDEPDGLNLEKLRKNLPVRWDKQWKRYSSRQSWNTRRDTRSNDISAFTVPGNKSLFD